MEKSKAIYLFHEGNYKKSYEFFGSHLTKKGCTFRVWAPRADYVAVVGSFNNWDEAIHPMTCLPDSGGIWECQIPGVKKGDLYKYYISNPNGRKSYKADPYALKGETPPQTASLVWDISDYQWQDDDWCLKRGKKNIMKEPMNIYEMHLGSWKTHEDQTPYTYEELALELPGYLKEMGYTHVEFLPVMEHPFGGSWGYQLTGYFATTSRYGDPQGLMHLIDTLHQAGISVILDWVPGHMCKDAHGLAEFDGERLYDIKDHPEWGTAEFDFGRPQVKNFLISNAYFWFDKFHIDGLRVDGVASMLYLNYGLSGSDLKNREGGDTDLEAIAFFKALNTAIFKDYPYAIMAAEESTSYPLVTMPVHEEGLGFNYKWDLGWMHDTLSYMETDPFVRSQFHDKLTFSMAYAFSENFILPLSHDEVVHGKASILDKMFGSYEMKFDQFRLLYAYMFFHPGKKLNFMGNEFAPFIEWRYDESLEWFMLDYEPHRLTKDYIQALNKLYLKEPALWQDDHDWTGFEWIDPDDRETSVLSFRRMGDNPDEDLVVVINFCPIERQDFRIGVPTDRTYRTVFNSDDKAFNGQGYTVKKTAKAQKMPWKNQPYSITLNIPPSTALVMKGIVPRVKAKTRKQKSKAKK